MRKAFTIVELLVCVAILVLLAAITYPLSASAIQAAKETKVRSNLSQLYKASVIYSADYQDHFAPGTIQGWPNAEVTGKTHLGFPLYLTEPICRKSSLNDPLTGFGWWIDWTAPHAAANAILDYEIYGESMIAYSNHSCNPPEITIQSEFQSRRAFGVELTGRVKLINRPGDWYQQEWWQ